MNLLLQSNVKIRMPKKEIVFLDPNEISRIENSSSLVKIFSVSELDLASCKESVFTSIRGFGNFLEIPVS